MNFIACCEYFEYVLNSKSFVFVSLLFPLSKTTKSICKKMFNTPKPSSDTMQPNHFHRYKFIAIIICMCLLIKKKKNGEHLIESLEQNIHMRH